MKKILLSAQVLTVLLLAACSDSKTKTTDVLADSATIKSTVLPAATSLPANPILPVTGSPSVVPSVVPNVSSPTTTTTSTPAPVVTTATGASGLNPAHGQPGHRCELAVGAPLNSKPTTTTPAITPQLTTLPVPTVNTNPVVNSTPQPVAATAPGMNPPHGQPGHRCDITVGQPLNSKPAATAPAAVISTPTVTTDSSKKQ